MSNYPRLDKIGLTRAINGIASKVLELIPGVFSRTENGLVPTAPSGSGTSKYLREDGTWNEPDSGISYGTCTTAAATAAKVVTLADASGWELKQGASVAVKFSNTNTFSATDQAPVTLNVNNTGAKNIYYGGSANPTGTNTTAFGRANYVNTYVYDGTYWVWTGSSADNNTTYSAMSKSELTTGTATTSRVVRADYLHAGIEQIAESAEIDTANNTATFTSSDTTDANATSWTSVTKLASGESHTSIFAKMSQMFKNIRYLYKMLGTTDISSIGDGTVTGGIDTLKDALNSGLNDYVTIESKLERASFQPNELRNVQFTPPTKSGYKCILAFYAGNGANHLVTDYNNAVVKYSGSGSIGWNIYNANSVVLTDLSLYFVYLYIRTQ